MLTVIIIIVIPGLMTRTEAVQSSVRLPTAVQRKMNEELMRTTVGPMDTITPASTSVQ